MQNFGFSSTANAGGPAGEIGGGITPAGEPAFYGKVITPMSFNDTLSASGILNVPAGGGHTLIGFFNANTTNEWRTPNTIALRIYGRGTYFLAYLEYGTGLWRAGATEAVGERSIGRIKAVVAVRGGEQLSVRGREGAVAGRSARAAGQVRAVVARVAEGRRESIEVPLDQRRSPAPAADWTVGR
jgi:hypothetical protein